jgi:hypothetical protein
MSNLGRSVSIHRGSFAAGGMMWYGGGIVALGSLIGLFQGLLGKGAPGQAAACAIGLPVSLAVVGWAYVRWKQVLEIFEGGFVWQRLIGTHTVTRDQIKEVTHVTHQSRRGTYIEVVVELTSGKSLSIVGVEDPGQAAHLLAGSAPASVASGGTGWTPPGGAQ